MNVSSSVLLFIVWVAIAVASPQGVKNALTKRSHATAKIRQLTEPGNNPLDGSGDANRMREVRLTISFSFVITSLLELVFFLLLILSTTINQY